MAFFLHSIPQKGGLSIQQTKVFASFLLFLFFALSHNLSARDQTDLETSLKKYLKRNEADRTYRFEEAGDPSGSLGLRPRDDGPVATQLLLKESFLLISDGLDVDIVDASLILEGTENEEDRLQSLSRNQAKLPILLSFPITKEEKRTESPSLSTLAENISGSDGGHTLYSFLPITTEDGKNFYLIKALGADGIVIDLWELETEMSAEIAMRQFERGKLGVPTRIRIKNAERSSTRAYEVFASNDDRGKLSKALHAVYGLTLKDDFILISTPQGIDHVRRDDLLKTHTHHQKEIPIQKTIPLPFTTGVVFLNSISPFGFPAGFKDELMLVSQWNPIIGESELTLFSDESPINQWTLNAPMLGLAKFRSYELFSPAGKAGIHYFKINPHEATIRGEFIKRDATLDPRYYSIEGPITGVWVSESMAVPTLHFSVSSGGDSGSAPCTLETSIEQTIDRARSVHRAAVSKAIDTPFTFRQGGKAFLNGLLSSIPFDADKLVDIFGFDLDKSLEGQLKDYQVADILTDDEKNEIRNTFSQVRNGGEIIGSAGQILFALKKIAEFRQFNFSRRAKQAKKINDIRRNLGLAKEDLTASGAPWLSEWKSAELLLADAKIAGFREKLSELLRHPNILTPEKFREILDLIEKTRNYERPFERVWIEIGQVAPIHQRIVQKLEYWTFKRLSHFFESVQPEEFAKAFLLHPSFVQDWERLKHLRLMEELGQFQKFEALALTAKIKSALMEAIASHKMRKLEQSVSDSHLVKALKKLQSKAGITDGEVKTLAIQIKHIADQIDKSEEAYRLARIIELNQPAQELSNLEKIEKLRHLVRCGWTGKAGEAATRALSSNREELIRALNDIYDHEQMLQSTFLERMFKHGKLSEAALFTLYSDAANVGIEWWIRKNDGRPFLSSGLAHNLFFNTYIMFPIFASTSFRVGARGKLFILVFNAVSTGYVNQKFVKFGGELFDTETPYQRWYQQWENLTPYEKATFLVPPPRRPLLDMPGYMMRSIFSRPGEDYNGGWALYDTSWTLGLSTPRGILFSHLGNYLSSRALLDQPCRSFSVARGVARFGPVVANETLGAATYTPIYGYFFEKSDHEPVVLDSKLETIDPWLTPNWEEQPKLRLSLSVKSSTPLEEVTFLLISNDTKLDVTIPENQWKERREQLYELVWEKEISPSDEPTVYIVKNLTLKNKDRWLGDALMPWKERVREEGVSVEVETPLMTWVQSKETFTQGLLKVFLSLAKEGATHYQHQKHHLAAGIVYMIAQYLDPFYRELVIHGKTHHLISDAFKEANRITQSPNYSDVPIEEENLGLLVQYLEKLSLEWSLQNLIPFRDETDNPRFQRSWIDFHSLKVLSKIQEEILKETRTAWLVLDEGGKNDWNTFQLFKGYAYGLLRLYRWYHYHFNEELSQTNRDALTRSLTILTELNDFGKELEASWLSNLHWSDSYLRELAEKFKELELCLSLGVKKHD